MFTYKIGLSTSEHDRFVIDSPQTNLLQSSSWAKIKDNWGNERVGFYQEDQLVAVASILIQPCHLAFPCSTFLEAQSWITKTKSWFHM